MKKKSNTDEFREIEAELDAFIKAKVEEQTAKVIYQREFSTMEKHYSFVIWNVDKVSFTTRKYLRRPVINKRATAEHVRQLREYFNVLTTEGEIIFHASHNDKYKTSTGIWLSEIDNDHYAFDEESLSDAIAKHNKIYDEKYAPREGCIPCDYCKKQVPLDKVVKQKIWYRGRDSFGIARSLTRIGNFCSGECAMNEQCSCEG